MPFVTFHLQLPVHGDVAMFQYGITFKGSIQSIVLATLLIGEFLEHYGLIL